MAVEQPSEGSDGVGVGLVVLKSGPDSPAQVF